MNEINTNVVDEAKRYVSGLLDEALPENCVFHTKEHTYDVLRNVELIGNYCCLPEHEIYVLRLSALFHDVGYVKIYNGHELQSALMAEEFLKARQITDSCINSVARAIKATKVPQQPKDLYSEILCDADLMHLTYDNYFEQIENMRKEWSLTGLSSFTEKEFHLNSLQFFDAHHYHTEYGRLILEPKKERIRKRIENRIAEL